LKLKCDEPLSNFAFNLHLRRYIKAMVRWHPDKFNQVFGDKVRRCRLTLSNPH
jgi:hypothetical protein